MDQTSQPETLGGKHLKKERLNKAELNWLHYLIFSSWLIISALFFAGIPQEFLWQKQKKAYEESQQGKSIPVIVENPESQEKEKTPDQGYISDESRQGKGSLTRDKGFELLSPYRDLSYAQRRKREREKLLQSKYATRPLYLDFTKLKDIDLWGYEQGRDKHTRIPENYKFRKHEALSFSKTGLPVIPTIYDKHAKYFKNMIDKIQNNFAPPGGSPYPVYGDNYHSSSHGYVPGRTSFQSFPAQIVYSLFMLDRQGNVIDSKISKSKGYQSLDKACLDAIGYSKNFGPPPKELLKDGVMIIPFMFKFAR